MNKLTANSESSNISSQAAAEYWQAALHRDPRADGKFFLAVRSPHIYCRPTCPARRPLPERRFLSHHAGSGKKWLPPVPPLPSPGAVGIDFAGEASRETSWERERGRLDPSRLYRRAIERLNREAAPRLSSRNRPVAARVRSRRAP